MVLRKDSRRNRPLWMRGGSTPTPPSPYYPVGTDCVLYDDFGDGLESAVDHSIYGNDGVIVGPTFGTRGGIPCLTFDALDDYVQIPDDTSLNIGTGDLTVYCWFYRDTNGENILYSLYGSTPSFMGFYMGCDNALGVHKAATCAAYISGDYTYWGYPERYPGDPAAEVQTGAWAFIAFCIDRDVGTKVWSSPYQSYSGSKGTTNSTNYQFAGLLSGQGIMVGKSNEAQVGGNWWDGGIGHILQFNAAKSHEEVLDFYNFTKARYVL